VHQVEWNGEQSEERHETFLAALVGRQPAIYSARNLCRAQQLSQSNQEFSHKTSPIGFFYRPGNIAARKLLSNAAPSAAVAGAAIPA
jgi:hypothetical protein